MFEIRTSSGDVIAKTDTLVDAVSASLSLPANFRPYTIRRTLTSANLDTARADALASVVDVEWINDIPVRVAR